MVSTGLGRVAALEFSKKGDLLLILRDRNHLSSCPLALKKKKNLPVVLVFFFLKECFYFYYYFCDGVFLFRSWGIIFLAVGEAL